MPHISEEFMDIGNTAVGMKNKRGIFPNAFKAVKGHVGFHWSWEPRFVSDIQMATGKT